MVFKRCWMMSGSSGVGLRSLGGEELGFPSFGQPSGAARGTTALCAPYWVINRRQWTKLPNSALEKLYLQFRILHAYTLPKVH